MDNIYLIYSNHTLRYLDNLFKDYGTIGYMKVVHVFNKELNKREETNRTLAIFSLETYQKMCADGLDGPNNRLREKVKVLPYKLNQRDYPKHETRDLFVPVPNAVSDELFVKSALHDKLEHYTEWNVIPKGCWELDVVVSSRQLGTLKGGCIIRFAQDVNLDQIALVKVLLDDTFWPESENPEETAIMRCNWAREFRESRNNKVRNTGNSENTGNSSNPNNEITNNSHNSGNGSNKPIRTNRPNKSNSSNNKPKKHYVPKTFT
jgi:hypothetical protein